MNRRSWLLGMACAIALCPSLQSQTDASLGGAREPKNAAKGRKGAIKKLDGTKFFGFVEVTDDYTIRITNDWGIARLPITQLSNADFRKYGFKKDRSRDGRFWYERKEALKSSQDDRESAQTAKSQQKSVTEIRLAEVSAFQPLIAAYEKTLASQSSKRSTTVNKPGEKPKTSEVEFRPMFSESGLGGSLPKVWPSLGASAIPAAPTASGLR
jgi:hypothetical protein